MGQKFRICTHLDQAVEEMYCPEAQREEKESSVKGSESRHKEESEKRRQLDKEDRKKMSCKSSHTLLTLNAPTFTTPSMGRLRQQVEMFKMHSRSAKPRVKCSPSRCLMDSTPLSREK